VRTGELPWLAAEPPRPVHRQLPALVDPAVAGSRTISSSRPRAATGLQPV